MDEIKLGFEDAIHAATEAENDLVGEAVGDEARILFRSLLAVLLAEDLRVLRVGDVVEPTGNSDVAGGSIDVAEGKHCSLGRVIRPGGEIHFLRRAGLLERVKTFRYDFEDAGLLEVVDESVVEDLLQRARSGVGISSLEVGNGDARFLLPKPG